MDVSTVINNFAFQYYTVWTKAPELLHTFYEKHCRMSYDGELLIGRQAVRLHATERPTMIAMEVVSVQGVLSTTGLLIVFVNGLGTYGGGNRPKRPRHFGQTFELRRHFANKFSIVTSMFHTFKPLDIRSVAVQTTLDRDERIKSHRRAKSKIQPKETGPAEVVD